MLGDQVELGDDPGRDEVGRGDHPCGPAAGPGGLRDGAPERRDRGRARHVVTTSDDVVNSAGISGDRTVRAVGSNVDGRRPDDQIDGSAVSSVPGCRDRCRSPDAPVCTSGTTPNPKLGQPAHVSYLVSGLSTMYCIGVESGDVHLNISSPGWAKHARATSRAVERRGDGGHLQLLVLRPGRSAGAGCSAAPSPAPARRQQCGGMVIQADLGFAGHPAGEVVGAGEPLNPEFIEQARQAWGVTIRNGFGQTDQRPGRQRSGHCHTGTSGPGTRTAASPTSGAPTTCSSRPTTGSRRSSWRACCWSTTRSPRRR